ncbi:glycosyltransferase family 2 protein [Coxiella burnetii]|uniref:Glycosyltransferase involved in cell wall biogenesis n=2 Tax=Coxiella burnetii TaxID=777 RepID=Q83CQ1_COXBU|nr:glycosyltransferase family 2 protein [Coxiella burnetii]NP_820058.1 cell wall biogenesis glycosyltransferase [Coxiella burnetii RSA 493]AAO90572.1 glycosyltransferase involved in cell wall biogenesis [Coxiella burnetii RSA 493]ABS78362.1 glycosyltransferase involved in cell wall biogenesis [Coxiella burnetii Dugway 5J108-111]ACJ18317.1 glycosyltransferase involved in cell wall biogenesis [Coxiella burnetii CbuG_Q212]AML49333.1 glycosyl transferase [Coxiella burnetii]AML55263.1 glycosyl tra
MKPLHSDIAVIIPAYNEQASIRSIVEPIFSFTDKVIIVDDGSTDATAAQLSDLPAIIIKNLINQGKGASLMRGFQHLQQLKVRAAICMDADTQHDPQDIPKFIEAMNEYPNHIIIGARTHNAENAPKMRRRANQVADFFISWAAGQRIIDTQSGYRLYPIEFLQNCLHQLRSQRFAFESEMLIQAARQGYLPVSISIQSHYPKNLRPSHYKPFIDTVKITAMVSWKLLSRGLYLAGLFRTLFKKRNF